MHFSPDRSNLQPNIFKSSINIYIFNAVSASTPPYISIGKENFRKKFSKNSKSKTFLSLRKKNIGFTL